jgi:hypothetical protein
MFTQRQSVDSIQHPAPRLAALGLLALASAAGANTVTIVETTTVAFNIRVVSTVCDDAARATIPGLAPVTVIDGHPSVATLATPRNPQTGMLWALAKGYANCPNEKWTAVIEDAAANNPYAGAIAQADIWKNVVVTNFLAVAQTVTIHVIITPERCMCLYDPGVTGLEELAFSLYDSRFTSPCWQRIIVFDGSEIGLSSVVKDGTTWNALPGPTSLPGFGTFGRGFRLADTPLDVYYPVQLQPNQTLNLWLAFDGFTYVGPGSGPAGARMGVVTNTVSLPPDCSPDFDGDGDIGTDADIEAFFACLAGDCCPTCGSVDFDGDGDIGTDADIEAFFRVLGGGSC